MTLIDIIESTNENQMAIKKERIESLAIHEEEGCFCVVITVNWFNGVSCTNLGTFHTRKEAKNFYYDTLDKINEVQYEEDITAIEKKPPELPEPMKF